MRIRQSRAGPLRYRLVLNTRGKRSSNPARGATGQVGPRKIRDLQGPADYAAGYPCRFLIFGSSLGFGSSPQREVRSPGWSTLTLSIGFWKPTNLITALGG